MQKIITLNMEGNKHYKSIIPFLEAEQADILCHQEAPEEFQEVLRNMGYHTSFAPMLKTTINNEELTIGLILATKSPHESRTVYYHQPTPATVTLDQDDPEHTLSIPYLMADILTSDGTYTVATTHLIDTVNGKEDELQTRIFENMCRLLEKAPPHIICGDFNMPRGHNALYPLMIQNYKDTVPTHYPSSLDRNIHRLGTVDIPEKIFDNYMVDYIFTQSGYAATDVRLQFGVSDHAAVIGHISISPTPPSHS
jgi:endonuclease/exonuclease/phosphatase family metal-dependent hydrolase